MKKVIIGIIGVVLFAVGLRIGWIHGRVYEMQHATKRYQEWSKVLDEANNALAAAVKPLLGEKVIFTGYCTNCQMQVTHPATVTVTERILTHPAKGAKDE